MAGVREAKNAANAQRIFAAGSELFEKNEYAAVTTNMLARHAGVSVGTLFRHIGSKAALFVKVMRSALRQPQPAKRPATTIPLAIEAVLALVEPFIELALRQPKNMVVFHHEVLYGEADSAEMVGVVQQLEKQIGQIVAELRGVPNPELSHTIYATVYMDFLQSATGNRSMEDISQRMRKSVKSIFYNWR